MGIETLGVIGAGQMGAGIAQVASASGLSVVMTDIKEEFLEKGFSTIEKNLGRMVAKEKITQEDRKATLDRIEGTTSIDDMVKADFVVEAAVENEELKLQIFRDLDNCCNPVPVMKLVEIIRGLGTTDETFQATNDLAEKFGKIPVPANDFPGFVANRILMPMINEAIYCVFEGVGTPEDIDQIMKLGMNHPMGPLALGDLVGLDTVLAILEVLQSGLGDDKYRPCPLLRKYVDAGWLGRKTGRGFYVYT